MFTGIIEQMGRVVAINKEQSNVHFTIESSLTPELKIDQSLAHDGVCLTVVSKDDSRNQYVITAMLETLERSNLRTWNIGSPVNLERSMRMDGRFDGHVVQGHVDQTAICTKVDDLKGSWRYVFQYDTTDHSHFTVEKGSITINGVSLTVVDSEPGLLSVAIIPYTYENTNFRDFKKGSMVNLEFDVFGKYVAKLFEEHLRAKDLK